MDIQLQNLALVHNDIYMFLAFRITLLLLQANSL